MAGKCTYVIGICGTGTGALAGLLQAAGDRVVGSDAHVYPPMSDKLAEWGIEVLDGFDAAHLAARPGIDRVVVGNVVRENNPEAAYVRDHKLPQQSMPQALAEVGIGGRHSVVVAGTHGKTTTTALMAHVLMHAGRDPGFLVGGALVGYAESFHLGAGDTFVVEGDEYDTAYFDKGPKFLHYRPKTVILTSVEFDHADIFADVAAVEAAFAKLVQIIPEDGNLIVWRGAPRAVALARAHARCRVTTYDDAAPRADADADADADVVAEAVDVGPAGARFAVATADGGRAAFEVPLWGSFGVHNALAVVAACRQLGLRDAAIAAGLRSFAGVRRRLEVRAEAGGVTLVDDFGHHPTAVAETIKAARARWPNRRLWALFEPRSATSRRNTFQAAYVAALGEADRAIVAHHPRLQEVPLAARFVPEQVAQALRAAGTPAAAPEGTAAIVAEVAGALRSGDVLLVLSNGDFAGLVPELAALVQAQGQAGAP